jgi:cobalt/nickel transport system permease protein
MAHIPDGVLSIPVLLAGAAVTVAGVGVGLKRLEPDRIPQAAVLSAVFFVASLVHLPAGPSSVHLLLSGLVGIVLGWAAFPAILVALLLQAVLFGFGGLLVLGVNVATMALPAVAAGLVFRRLWRGEPRRAAAVAGVLAALAVMATAGLVAMALAGSGQEFVTAAKLVALTALPVAAVEAAFTAAAVGLVARVKPAMLGVAP